MVELLEGTALDEEQRKYISVMRRSVENLIGLVEGLEAPEKSSEQVAIPATSPGGLRMLLVDDSEDNRFLILRYLSKAGISIDQAGDGAEAFAKFTAGDYDLVLMDIEMP